MERKKFDYNETALLDDYPVEKIRIVKVPHMSSFASTSETIPNIRTNVGVAGEAYVFDCSFNIDIMSIRTIITV